MFVCMYIYNIYKPIFIYRYIYYILEINTCIQIGIQDNNYYQTVALAETVVLPWGACSPQLTTNVFFFIFKRVVVKMKHTIIITRTGTKVAMSDKEIRFFQTRNM